MALFSFFGKKKQPSGKPEEELKAHAGMQEPPPSREKDYAAIQRESMQLQEHRQIARMTTEKIDAIESEIARDFLKAPPVAERSEDGAGSRHAPAEKSIDPFQATIIRADLTQSTVLRTDLDD